MELTQLRYFMEVAESQHMTRSAEKLHIAQSALSRTVKRLEEELSVPLFAARGRNIVLTEYGRYLKEKLAPALSSLEALPEDLRTMARLEEDTIHMNVLAATTVVTNVIIEYKKSHENVHFQMRQQSESELYDIGVTTRLPGAVAHRDDECSFSVSERIFLALPAAHPRADEETLALHEMAGEGFISLMGSRQLRFICDHFCHQAGFEPKVIFESDSPAVVQNMIAANMGVGFWPEFSWGRLKSDRVRLVPIKGPDCRREIVVDYRQNKADCARVRDFFGFLRDYCMERSRKERKRTR